MQNQNQKLLYCPECGTSTAVHVIDANKKGLFRCLTCYLEFTTEKQAILDGMESRALFMQFAGEIRSLIKTSRQKQDQA